MHANRNRKRIAAIVRAAMLAIAVLALATATSLPADRVESHYHGTLYYVTPVLFGSMLFLYALTTILLTPKRRRRDAADQLR